MRPVDGSQQQARAAPVRNLYIYRVHPVRNLYIYRVDPIYKYIYRVNPLTRIGFTRLIYKGEP